ncbi:MAG: ABC transporter permease [Chitinophagales bacterium]|nr:ABC transporter permease [Bacteroidota bacterium]
MFSFSKKIWLIIQREYITRVRKKSFIISTILAPVGLVLLLSAQFFFMNISESSKHIAVCDESGLLYHTLPSGKMVLLLTDNENIFFKDLTNDCVQADSLLAKDQIDGVLKVSPTQNLSHANVSVVYLSNRVLGVNTRMYIENKIGEVLHDKRLQAQGIEPVIFDKTKVDVHIVEMQTNGNESSSFLASGIGMGMGFLMYLVLIVYGTMVMRGVAEEKSNRIVELILSSVRPFELMMGKILGIGAVGLTQFIIWIVTSMLIMLGFSFFVGGNVGSMQQQMDPQAMEMAQGMSQDIVGAFQNLPLGWLLFAFLFYFFTGYLLYAALFAALGAAIGESDEQQSLVFPIILPIILSFFILIGIQENPHSGLGFWTSMLPFSSPIIMPARLAYGAPLWQLFVSMLLMLIGFLAITWLAARIYRMGILMYGKKVTLKEISKWLWVRGA